MQPSGRFLSSRDLPVWNLRFFSNTRAFAVEAVSRGGGRPPSLAPSQYEDSGLLDPEAVLPADEDFALSTAFSTSLAQWSCPTLAETPTGASLASSVVVVGSLDDVG